MRLVLFYNLLKGARVRGEARGGEGKGREGKGSRLPSRTHCLHLPVSLYAVRGYWVGGFGVGVGIVDCELRVAGCGFLGVTRHGDELLWDGWHEESGYIIGRGCHLEDRDITFE